MGNKKPEGWKEALNDCITEGLNYKETNTKLVGAMGEEGKVSGAAYGKNKQKLQGSPEVDEKLAAIGEVRHEKKQAQTKLPQWTKAKQKTADESTLAKLMNKGMHAGLMPFCKNKKLTVEDVQDINVGGAVVGSVQHYFPDLNLDHPLILLATRGIMLYLRMKQICAHAQDIVEGIKEKLAGTKVNATESEVSGIKPEFALMGE